MKKALSVLISILFASLTFAQYTQQDAQYESYYQYYAKLVKSYKFTFSSSREAGQAASDLNELSSYFSKRATYFNQQSRNTSNIEQAREYQYIAGDFQEKANQCKSWASNASNQARSLQDQGR